LTAGQRDKRFQSIAPASMFTSGLGRRNGVMDSPLATLPERLQQASAARAQ